MTDIRKSLTEKAKAMGWKVSAAQADQFQTYMELLLEWNEKMNLTAITQPEEVVEKHFLDSLTLLAWPKLKQGAKVIDVGTGAGFPGLPLRILEPSLQLTLLDSLGKRVNWLASVCDTLGLEGVECLHARAEEQALVKGFRDSFDFATARAVADLRLLCELCLPYVKVGGPFLAMKSTDRAQELEDAAHCIKLLGGRAEEPVDYAIPGTQVTHRVLPIRKLAPTLKGYPRRWAKIQKAPL